MGTVEELGLLKMDMLGLRTLTVISEATRLITGDTGDAFDIDSIPIDDQLTYEMLTKGETAGVFQLESSGMRGILKELKPEVFEDIIALVALYCPAPWAVVWWRILSKTSMGLKKRATSIPNWSTY